MKNMMKKIVCGAAALATLVTSAAFCSTTASAEKWGALTYEVSGNIITITNCDKNTVKVSIPSAIDGKIVAYIGANAFKDCKKLVSVRMPKTLKEVRNNAFENCVKLKDVQFHLLTSKIESNAFKNCSALKGVIIDSTSAVVASNAFPSRSTCHVIWCKGNPNENPNPKNTNQYFKLGDTNGDTNVDMVDAQAILSYYAESVAGNISPETDPDWYYNRAVMDVDRDGSIDAADAQYVFGYYMNRLSKKTSVPFDVYMFTGYYNYL